MIPSRIKHNRRISALCFGTAQLGMRYGIANRTGMPDMDSALALLSKAYVSGITLFDTARAYGEAELRLGSALRTSSMEKATVITKLDPLEGLVDTESEKAIVKKVEESVHQSLSNLAISFLPYVLLHRPHHLHACQGKIWQALLSLKQRGIIERLGVSVVTPQDAVSALQFPDIECIELPFNLLDWRWEQAGIPALFAQRPDMLVLARSGLLQGVLTQDASAWPIIEKEEAEKIINTMDRFSLLYSRMNWVDLCMAYVRSQPWIDSVVLGMETMQQLQENVILFGTPLLSAPACNAIRTEFSRVNERLLTPACWPKVER